MVGSTISHYKILEKIGEGGMGVVYKAQDTKLDRLVALKFLPERASASEQDKSRFMQEARAAAALSHPNICTIYGIEEHGGQMFIAMEYVDGQTLRDKKDAISFKQAIDIGIQIAEGLAAAHEKGIVHRDVKPENIMVRKDGIVQVMDFGLAKLRGSVTRLTKQGSTVGTAGYMSPEQVQGQDADHRSDIFSFGVVVYELLTGQLPFKGVHETALAYEIVNVDAPPMSSIKPDIEPTLDAIILECLEKDPNERTQSMKQVSIDLKRHRRESSRQRVSRVTAARPALKSAPDWQPAESSAPVRRFNLAWTVASLCLLGMAAFAFLLYSNSSTEIQSISSYILPPENLSFAGASGTGGEGQFALSPDGTMIAMVVSDSSGKTHLVVRALSLLTVKELPTTEGAYYPFWSYDSRYIAFFQSGKLKKIEASGGPSVTICEASDGRSGAWNQAGIILFSPTPNSPIFKVSESGGTPTPVTTLDSSRHERSHRWSSFLPDGKHFLYFARASFGGVEREDDALVVASLDGKESKRLMPSKANGCFASGYLVYLREKTLMAQPFDPGKLEPAGDAIPIAEPVEFDINYNHSIFSLSQNGLLLYQASTAQGGFQLEWFDRNGKSLGKIGDPAEYGYASISPNDKQIAFDMYDTQSRNRDIWLYDLGRGLKTRFTFDPAVDEYPVWSPEGGKIVFHSDRKGHYDLFVKATTGAGLEEVLLESSDQKFPYSWSPDGKYIAYGVNDPKTKSDMWMLPMEGDRRPFPFLQTEFDEGGTQFSPDMRWVAYGSDESGRPEIYVRPFLGLDGKPAHDQSRKWQISTNGFSTISAIKWSRSGKEFFYMTNDNKFMSAEVKTNGSSFDVGAVRPLFELHSKGINAFADVTSDAKKFLFALQVGGQTVPPLTLVTNWNKELRKK